LIAFVSAAKFLLSSPAASKLPAYSASVQPEAFVTSGVRKMGYRGSYALGKLFDDNHSARLSVAAGERMKVQQIERENSTSLRYIEKDDPRHADNVRQALLAGANLSEGQMFAMMQMSAERSQQAIWHYARQNIFEYPPFTRSTFFELRDLGYAELPEGSKYHRLTAKASELASAVADELVRKHKIHAPYVLHPRENSMQSRMFCVCGWTKTLTIGGNMQIKAHRHFTNHVISINAVERLADAISISPRQGGEEG